ncbi:MAG: 30S ribosomal protein S20 [Patescibacteria group bacterium]|nr:30S ribosomal protein S20 [Patescibacteria group bacterium]MDD5715878.1 30S ribosomal protein S20 [Patescibacteria group bacterium]
MPNKHASFKHLRQTKVRTERNNQVEKTLKEAVKSARAALSAQDKAKAADAVKKAAKLLDKAAQNKVIKRNTAGRIKSRLGSQLAKIK